MPRKKEISRYNGVIIRNRVNPSGTVSYRVECPIQWFGKTAFRQFKTVEAAEGFIDDELAQRREFGALAQSLTHGQRVDAIKAFNRLKHSSASLEQCVDFYLRHHLPVSGDITVGKLISEFIAKREKGLGTRRARMLRPRALGDIKQRLKRFAVYAAAKRVLEVSPDELSDWIHNPEWSMQSRLNYWSKLHSLFSYAVEQGYLAENPVKKVSRPVPDRGEIGILTPAQFRKLLTLARDTKRFPTLLAYLVLGGFCGVRPEEISHLEWSDVDLNQSIVTISSKAAKGRNIRNTEIPKNAVKWLQLCRETSGPVVTPYSSRRRKFEALRLEAGIADWPHDALRHSAGSYHYALHEDSAKTAAQLGHVGDNMLFKHYRALTTKKEARKFFAIAP